MDYTELFGEELGPKVKENMPNGYVIVEEENHVTKDSFNSEREKLKSQIEALKTQIEDRDKQIEQLKEDTNTTEELKQKIEELQENNKKTEEELQQKLQMTQLESKIDKVLLKEKARNPKAVKALLNMEKIKEADDQKQEIKNQTEEIKESDDYLFGETGLKGDEPEVDGKTPPNVKDNPFKPGSVNLTKQGQLIKNDPDKARKLIKAAGGKPEKYGL